MFSEHPDSEQPAGRPSDPGRSEQDKPGAADVAADGAASAKAALHRARASARERGDTPARGNRPVPPNPAARRRAAAGQGRSGAHPDARDPQLMSSALRRLVAEYGWDVPVAVGGVMGRWDAVVGTDMAAHCTPETFEDSILTIRADSTAWATQVRLLVPSLMARLSDEVGKDTVRRIVVKGPSGPSWRRGARTVRGRGPRDTYG